MCEIEESEEENKKAVKKILGGQVNNGVNSNDKAKSDKTIKKEKIKKEKSVEANCNCGDCIYKHRTIESDDDDGRN
jgi:hypothetical protein